MHKLPVFATAGHAFRFLMQEFGTIMRLSWLLVLIMLLLQYFASRAFYAEFRSALEASDPAGFTALASTSVWNLVNAVVTMLGGAIVAVALHRVILFGDRQPGRYIYLAFGKVELLFVLLPFIAYAAIAAIFLSGAAIAAFSQAPLFFALLTISAVIAFIFLLTRLSVIFPVTVVERRYDFGQTWALTRGNFWRILGLWLVVFIPIWAVTAIVQLIVVGVAPPTNPADIVDRMEGLLIPSLIVSFFAFPAFGALGVAVLSYSYKALNGLPPDAVLSPR